MERKEGSTGSGGGRGEPRHEIGREERRWSQWRVSFSLVMDPGVWIEGRLRFTHHSRWVVLLDLENDVLAGDYLPVGDVIEVGLQFKLDDYNIVVGEYVQIDLRSKASEVIDLTESIQARPGGRFWVLLESDDEDQAECVPSRVMALPAVGLLPEPMIKIVRRRSNFENSKPAMKP